MTIRRRLRHVARKPIPYWASPAARALFQNISEAMSDGMLVCDRQGRIILVNPALGRMLGREPQSLLGQTWAALFFDGRDANDAFNDLVLEVVQNQVCHHNRQVTYHPPQGPPRELIVTTDLLLDQGSQTRDAIGMLAVFRDVSEMKALHHREQELLQKSRRLYQEKLEGLEHLARAVAHEIRNPVMSIGGLSLRLLSQCGQEGQQAQYLERIVSSSRRLEEIVEQVEAYASLPAPRPEPLALLPWLQGLAQAYQARAQAQGVAFQGLEAPPELAGLTASADPKLLERLMRVLLDNALEAMPQGGGLRLELARQDDPAEALISVTDSGKGIAPEDLPFIFDPFFTTKAAGVGMNLAMAKRIADEHGARLTALSQPGQGATFSLSLPLG